MKKKLKMKRGWEFRAHGVHRQKLLEKQNTL